MSALGDRSNGAGEVREEACAADVFRRGLLERSKAGLVEIAAAIGLDTSGGVRELVERILQANRDAASLASRVLALDPAAGWGLALLVASKRSEWPADAWREAMLSLGADARETWTLLGGLGLAVLVDRLETAQPAPPGQKPQKPCERPFETLSSATLILVPEEILKLGLGRIRLPHAQSTTTRVRQVREADAMDRLLRLSALWQLVDAAPPRISQSGVLFKRDLDRLEKAQTLAGPAPEAPLQMPRPVEFWLDLAWSIGLVRPEPDGDRILPARYDFWEENAFHLDQMIAIAWLSPESSAPVSPEVRRDAALRTALILRLAGAMGDEWVACADLADALASSRARSSLLSAESPAARSARGKAIRKSSNRDEQVRTVEAVLLEQAYSLGLVRTAEAALGEEPLVSLSALGRYALGLGPPPAPPQPFEKFLYVQPNFEIIAYRQGLNAYLLGQLARFADWVRLDAAVTLSVTQESVYRGLESGLSPAAIAAFLDRHAARPAAAAFTEALADWSRRRERVIFHPSAALLEFARPEDLEAALSLWSEDARPERINDRLLLVEDDSSIPYHAFRLTGSRDYRKPSEACVHVQPDGVTLELDPARSDLLIDAELERLAEPSGSNSRSGASPNDPGARTYRITPRSLGSALRAGMTAGGIDEWFRRRTEKPAPASVRLLLLGLDRARGRKSLKAGREWVLRASSPEIIDGLLMYPETASRLGERLGPRAVSASVRDLPELAKTLAALGYDLENELRLENGDDDSDLA